MMEHTRTAILVTADHAGTMYQCLVSGCGWQEYVPRPVAAEYERAPDDPRHPYNRPAPTHRCLGADDA